MRIESLFLTVFILSLISFLLWGLHYWLIVITEGIFLGRRFVVWLYDREAYQYDEIKEYSIEDERILVVDPILGELNSKQRPLLLDVGTGTGRVPHFLLADGRFIFENHGQIIGLEPSQRMLTYAIDHLRPFPPHVSWIRQYATPLPFKADSFDGVTSLETLEFFPDPDQALREMVRVVKPGGFVMVTRRREWEGYLFLNRYYSKERFEKRLEALGLQEIGIYLWQNNYDLVIGRKLLRYE